MSNFRQSHPDWVSHDVMARKEAADKRNAAATTMATAKANAGAKPSDPTNPPMKK
jgi:hypothetical protein